jgi:hypothetical protein
VYCQDAAGVVPVLGPADDGIATKHYCLQEASLLEGGAMIPADAVHEVIRHSAGAIDVSE